ncbi:MAG: hypothetical protein KGZ65_08230 [Sphingomonadales bacterium]|nr:hypothetical protein [Sphingomonadaceae bacterium]MBS3931207.1 hypothetical protein [Sphingomonadales bacterium]
MHGQVIERLSAKSNVAKERMDWEVSMGQDRMIAGQLYGRDLQAITRSFKADLDQGASSVLKDCGNAKRQIKSKVADIDGIAVGTLSVCYSAASDLEKLAKLGLAKNLRSC